MGTRIRSRHGEEPGLAWTQPPVLRKPPDESLSRQVASAGPAHPRAAHLGPPPGTRAKPYLRRLRAQLEPIARGNCDHAHAEAGYKLSRKLKHLINVRNARCTAPGCGRPAARCDKDHTTAWHKGGITCECNLAPQCKR